MIEKKGDNNRLKQLDRDKREIRVEVANLFA